MQALAETIQRKIRGKTVLLGIGNILRGDDGFGPKCLEALAGKTAISLVDAGTAPENHIFPVLEHDPGTVIFLDAAVIGKAPGQVGVYEMTEIDEIGFSTHNASIGLLADLLKTSVEGLNIFAVLIQPKDTAFGSGISGEVQEGIAQLVKIFSKIAPPV